MHLRGDILPMSGRCTHRGRAGVVHVSPAPIRITPLSEGPTAVLRGPWALGRRRAVRDGGGEHGQQAAVHEEVER
jgi:hypothetical protein